jgi:hypothetical protein
MLMGLSLSAAERSSKCSWKNGQQHEFPTYAAAKDHIGPAFRMLRGHRPDNHIPVGFVSAEFSLTGIRLIHISITRDIRWSNMSVINRIV